MTQLRSAEEEAAEAVLKELRGMIKEKMRFGLENPGPKWNKKYNRERRRLLRLALTEVEWRLE